MQNKAPSFLGESLHVNSELTLILFHPHIWVVGRDREGSYTWTQTDTNTSNQ